MSTNPMGNYESYIESWGSATGNGLQRDMDALKAMNINSHTTINISFCSFDFASGNPLPGLQYGTTPQENIDALKTIVDYIHSRDGKVKLSFGGANGAYGITQGLKSEGPEKLAADVANVINSYGLDGVDLDIEDRPSGDYADDMPIFMEHLRNDLGDEKIITLTVPGQDWGEETWIKSCMPYINTFNFMEYDIWVDSSKTEVEQIKSDIEEYINQWGIPPDKIQLGVMPGTDDMGRNMNVDDVADLVKWAKSMGLAGMMTWDLNRDYEAKDGASSMYFSNTIEYLMGFGSENRINFFDKNS